MAILPIHGRDGRAVTPAPTRRRALALAAIGLLITTLALAPAAMAAGLSLTTPYPAVSVAPGSKVSFSITVSANPSQQVAVSVSGTPADWKATLRGGGYVVNGIQTDETGKATLSLEVQVPATAADGVTHLAVAGESGGARSELPLAITVNASMAGDVTLASDVPSLQGSSSSTFTFNLTLSNDSAEDLTFAVTATGPTGWEVNATLTGQAQAASAVIKAGSTSAVQVSAKPPSDVLPATYPIEVKANVGDRSIDAALSVKVTGTNALTVTTPDARLSNSGSAGSEITQQLVIRNDGTQPLEQVTVTASPPTDWKVTFSPSATIASIAAGASETITATLVPSNDAIAGDYVVTYRASSSDANGSVDIRMTIETSPLFGFVGLALIVLVLAGLWWVFQRYGRR